MGGSADVRTLPLRQHVIRDRAGTYVARVDFAYPDIKVAIQSDGYLFHARQEDWLRDRHQDNVLAGLGWHVLRYTWHDVTERPDLMVGEMAAFF